ncbi:MAG: hypothetical protein IJ877_02920 [Candidatus Gastranaerophilales bacterium]|nr:hypothetical protein [Candidatus Gastranaerophilales bacterium]
MFDFFIPKSKIQSYKIVQIPIAEVEMIGIAQINPYCNKRYENEVFVTVVNILNDSKHYDERESIVLSKYFMLKKCPKCKKTELIPLKIRANFYPNYLRNEEEVAWDAYDEFPSKTNTPSTIEAYCNSCNSCFEIRIKTKDSWIKQLKKLKDKDLITPWEEYKVEY